MMDNDHGWVVGPNQRLMVEPPLLDLTDRAATLDYLYRLCRCPTMACTRAATAEDMLCDECRGDAHCMASPNRGEA